MNGSDDFLLDNDENLLEQIETSKDQSENSSFQEHNISIQVNYTDTTNSHRFVRFEIPNAVDNENKLNTTL